MECILSLFSLDKVGLNTNKINISFQKNIIILILPGLIPLKSDQVHPSPYPYLMPVQ